MFTLLRGLNQNVQFVDRRHNNLKDVPVDVLASFKTLEEVLLDSNHIRNLPKGLFRLIKLKKLSLSENEIIHLPSEIGNLSALVDFNISKNDLFDIPDSIKYLEQLQVADFSSNPLKRISLSIVHLQNLTDLRLNDVDLTELPSDFGRLINLRTLELRDNMLKDLPSSFVSLTNLECLDLGSNMFEDMPSCLCQLVMLRELWLDSNEISALVSDIKKLKKLKCLDITENDLEFLPEEISGLESLTDLYASQNYLQVLPNGIGNLHELNVFKVDHNRLLSLPVSMGKCTKLQELVLKENEISFFPVSFGQLSNLSTLIADCNKLNSLPVEICNLSKLSLLSLRDNCLYYLPEDIGRLKELQVLDLCGNRLQYLPVSIMFLNLKALWLSENQHQPLLKFQRDFDWKTRRDIITCYMLPQQEYTVDYSETPNCTEGKPLNTRQRVEFEMESEDELEKSVELVRHGTPYPKDLKSKVIKLLPLKSKAVKNADDKEKYMQHPAPLVVTDCGTTNVSLDPVCNEEEHNYHNENHIQDVANDTNSQSLLFKTEIQADVPEHFKFSENGYSTEKINVPNENDFPVTEEPYASGNHQYDIIEEVVNIYVQREPCGLGLSIAGGKESTPFKGDDGGIFVSKVTCGGPSDKAGLKVDDKILKVNDVPMTDIDHYTAVQVLRNAGNSIRFMCMRERQVLRNLLKDKTCSLPVLSSPIVSSSVQQANSIFQPQNTSTMKFSSEANNHGYNSLNLNTSKNAGGSRISYRPLPDSIVNHRCNGHQQINSSQTSNAVIPSSNEFHLSNHQLPSFEPDMTSTPLTLSRASSKDIPDIIQPANLNSLVHSASYDTGDRYEGPVVTVTVQNPRPYVPLAQEFPPPTKALGETSEVLTKSSHSETTTTRLTSNSLSIKGPTVEEVTLTKLNGPLGLSIMGGFDQTCLPFGAGNPGIFVSRIAANGTAAKTGKIRVGDRILEVNNVDLSKATHSEAVSSLCFPADEVKLLIQHDALPHGWQEIIVSRLHGEILGVEINGGLGGLRVNPFDFDDEGVFITKILLNSAAARDSRLKVGMRVIEVSNTSLLGATYEEANHTINCTGDTVSFLVCDGFNNGMVLNMSYSCLPESSSVTIDSVPCIDSDDDSIDIFRPSNQELLLAEEKSVDEKVLDVVHAAERLVTPTSRFLMNPPHSLRKKKTTTIILSKHTLHPMSTDQKQCSEPAYLPCEV